MDETLSKRERQIMDVVYSLGRATATQVIEGMESPPSRSAVRTFLTILERRGHLRHRRAGKQYVYEPTQPRRRAGRGALRRVIDVFFGGSLENAVAAHLGEPGREVPGEELERIADLIAQARKKGK